MIKYFRELLATLKSIDEHLEELELCVSKQSDGRTGNTRRLRVDQNKFSS